MKILFLGDIVGNSGCVALKKNLPSIIKQKKLDFVVVNGENAAKEGVGITENITNELIGPIPKNKTVWYQKHMSQHNLPGYNLEWINKITNCILIRNPKDVIASFSKKFKLISSNQLGYKQQTVIYNLTKHNNKVIIIDADDILKNTEYIIKKLCYKLKIPFYKQMLSWPKGKRQSDGIWSRYWYKEVELSTGFNCYSNNKNTLFKDYYSIYLDCMDDYELLYDIRIK